MPIPRGKNRETKQKPRIRGFVSRLCRSRQEEHSYTICTYKMHKNMSQQKHEQIPSRGIPCLDWSPYFCEPLVETTIPGSHGEDQSPLYWSSYPHAQPIQKMNAVLAVVWQVSGVCVCVCLVWWVLGADFGKTQITRKLHLSPI